MLKLRLLHAGLISVAGRAQDEDEDNSNNGDGAD
jgi:hypothetical protein